MPRLLEMDSFIGQQKPLLIHLKSKEGVGRLYCHWVTIVVDKPLNEVMGENLSFSVNHATGTRRFNGYVDSIQARGRVNQFYRYQLVLVPEVWQKLQKVNSDIYLDKSLSEIIRDKFQRAKVSNYDLDKITNNHRFDYLVQYQKSDWQFLDEIMRCSGVSFYFSPGELQKICFLNDTQSFFANKNINILSEKRATNLDDKNSLCKLNKFISNDVNAQAGLCVSEWLITECLHEAHDYSNIGSLTKSPMQFYKNTSIAIDKLNFKFPQEKFKNFHGIQTAKTAENPSKLIYPWASSKQSKRCEVLVKRADSSWGDLFPKNSQEKAIVKYLDDDINQPYICGSLYHNLNHEPFELPKNKSLATIKGQHELQFSELKNSEKMTINSANNLRYAIGHNANFQIEKQFTTIIESGDQLIKLLQGAAKLQAKNLQFVCGKSQIILNETGITLSADKIQLGSENAKNPVAKVGDQHQCDTLSALQQGDPTVLINNQAIITDGAAVHCSHGSNAIKSQIHAVTVSGKPIAIKSTPSGHGKIISGSFNVFA